MNRTRSRSSFNYSVAAWPFLVVAGWSFASRGDCAIIWNGPPLAFTNQSITDIDRITPDVWITRGSSLGIFNAESEASFQHFFSPSNTEWANGTTADYATLSYTDWNTWAKIVNGGPPNTVGTNAVVHLIAEDIYLDLKFTSWPVGAGFSYIRSTPGVAPVPPVLNTALASGDGTFQFSFTNVPGYNFTILAVTNISLAPTNWIALGLATYSLAGPGFYEFVDPGAGTNQPQRFYRVSWP